VKRAGVLANMTNDGWFAGNDQAWQHVQIAVFRSIENRVPTVRAVNTGVSGLIDSVGRIGPVVTVDGRSEEVAGTAAGELVIDPRRTVFGHLGHAPVIGLAVWTACSVALAVFAPRGRRGRERGADR
jgi:apolipoprotein N-acyltransferase